MFSMDYHGLIFLNQTFTWTMNGGKKNNIRYLPQYILILINFNFVLFFSSLIPQIFVHLLPPQWTVRCGLLGELSDSARGSARPYGPPCNALPSAHQHFQHYHQCLAKCRRHDCHIRVDDCLHVLRFWSPPRLCLHSILFAGMYVIYCLYICYLSISALNSQYSYRARSCTYLLDVGEQMAFQILSMLLWSNN